MTKLKCIILKLSLTKGWKQSSNDKQASEKLAIDNQCDSRLCKVNLKLFDNGCTQAINKLYTFTRDEIKRLTLPTGNESEYIVPTSSYESVRELLDDSKRKLTRLLADLEVYWQSYIDSEIAKLGSFYDASKYPTSYDIVDGTRLSAKFAPIAESNSFADLFDASDMLEELQNQHDIELQTLQNNAGKEMLSRLSAACQHAIGILYRYHHEDGKRISTDDVISVLRQRVEDVNALNFVGDAEVQNQCDEILSAIRSCDHTLLKSKEYADGFSDDLKLAIGIAVAMPAVASPVVASPVVASPVVASPVVASPVVASPVVASPVVASPVVASMPKFNINNLE